MALVHSAPAVVNLPPKVWRSPLKRPPREARTKGPETLISQEAVSCHLPKAAVL